ncbi:hypothetical protein HHI36_008660 [Cryptolaemus montrouzieri]|uniref:Fibronectin type 3 and ankyrin repeat domains protein 1 n=1 Tax=Cryptolaemus montrouzieri TaxID=559131 RepID=A0ABD2MT05_9CUCU
MVCTGNKTSFIVKNLAPSEVYTFRIRSETLPNWVLFKRSTLEGPFFTTRHLLSAMRSKKFSVIRKIIKERPDLLEIENKKANTPLVQAIRENDMKMSNLLLHLGANINNHLMFSKKTPLMIAVNHGYFDLTKFLVNKGASIQDVDINGLGLLHNAVDTGNFEMVEYFVGLGLDVNARDKHGLTPLLRAVILEVDNRIVEFLLQNGADESICDRNGFNATEHKGIIDGKLKYNVPPPKFIFL